MRRSGGTRTVVAVALACLSLPLLPGQAAAAVQHRISGTVRAASGGDLPDVYVDLYRDDGTGTFAFYAPVDGDPDPHFSVVVPDGRYQLKISTADPESFQDEWYDDQPTQASATVVALNGADVVLEDIVIEGQPTITGKVVDEQGAPIAGIRVAALDAVTFNSAWPVWTERDGTFESEVYPGDWTLAFDDDGAGTYAREYLGDANSRDTGTVVSVQGGPADVGTVVMSEGGSIAGTVTGPDGLPMRDFRVVATAGTSEPASDWTDRDGHYELPMLTPGDYAVRFDDDEDNFVTEFYDGAADQASADPVPVTDHEVTAGIDATVTGIPHPAPSGVDVMGRITDSSGRGVPGASIFAFSGQAQGRWDDELYEEGRTDATGRYYLTQLDGRDVSTFKIKAHSYPGGWDDDDYLLAGQWYGGVNGVSTIADAVAVVPGAPATADITLPDAGLLHGRTFTTGGTGFPGHADGSIVADDQHGHQFEIAWIYSDVWKFNGGVPPGTYHLRPDGIGCPGGSLEIDVVVRSLQETNVPGAAFCRPRVTVAPSIQGTPAAGEVVTVDPGVWSAGSVPAGYEWLVDGTPVATGPSYAVRPEDGGHQLAVRVTRRTDFACCSPVTETVTTGGVAMTLGGSTGPPPPVVPSPAPGQVAGPRPSSVEVTGRSRRHAPRVTLRVVVTSAGAPAVGGVTVSEGPKALLTGRVSDGVVVLRLRHAKAGRHTYTITYAGTDAVLPSTATVTVRVPRAHSAS